MPFWIVVVCGALALYNLPLLCVLVMFVGIVQWDTERQR